MIRYEICSHDLHQNSASGLNQLILFIFSLAIDKELHVPTWSSTPHNLTCAITLQRGKWDFTRKKIII